MGRVQRERRQYPWELLVNRPRNPLMPPRTQVILMHRGVALEIADIDDIDAVRRLDTVLLEPIGYLVYNERRTFYGGVSAVVSFPSGESLGIGPMIHLGPWAKPAWVFRRDAPESPGSGLVVTDDLLQMFMDAPAQYRQARDPVAGELLAAVGRMGDGGWAEPVSWSRGVACQRQAESFVLGAVALDSPSAPGAHDQ